MKYEKAAAEVIPFDSEDFIVTSGDTPLGSFTCGYYTQGGSCTNIKWSSTGYSCGSYTNGNCQNISSPSGSMGDGCYAWKLTCSKF
ncbi:MAG: hypothetical protein IKP22_14465 [Clostridia bacterium]|nr:hypothetical protein [Clostridia bacterium]